MGSRPWFSHFSFRVFRQAILFICVLRLAFPALDNYLIVFNQLQLWPIVSAGIFMMFAGFSLTIAGHINLGENWSSGVDTNRETNLVNNGLYSKSRNPMFIGIIVTQIGFLLALPSLFALLCIIAGNVAIINQLFVEERFLRQRFGDSHIAYTDAVPRWL